MALRPNLKVCAFLGFRPGGLVTEGAHWFVEAIPFPILFVTRLLKERHSLECLAHSRWFLRLWGCSVPRKWSQTGAVYQDVFLLPRIENATHTGLRMYWLVSRGRLASGGV